MGKITDYYRVVSPSIATTVVRDNQLSDSGYAATNNFTWYARLVQGSGTRLARYNEYNIMDTDVEIARALDIIAEEMTSKNSKTRLPLDIDMLIEDGQQVDDTLVMTLRAALRHWSKIHGFDENRLFKLARNTVKYGDCFFRKKSNYKKWEWIPSSAVVGAIVDSTDVTNVIGYQIRTDLKEPSNNSPMSNSSNTMKSLGGQGKVENVPVSELVVFSINDDMSDTAPFGESVLRTVYKTHKQKELLEDAIIIYRIQRAPERRVFYVDVGQMPPHRVKTYLETIKNELKQKKIPSVGPNGQQSVDSIYNPHCLALDTLIPLLDGRVLPLSDIISEYESGNELWAYSADPETGEFAPGIISWAGVTRKNTEVIKLIFNNGKSLICTADHKIPVRGRGFVEAKDLTGDDSLFAHNTIFGGSSVYDHHKNEWIDIDLLDDKVFWGADSCGKESDAGWSFAYIASIESVNNTMDVGTLTIDQNESIHNWHTFAVDAGIYVKNSTCEDIFLAQKCLSLDTTLEIQNVGPVSLHEVIIRHNNGIKQNVVTVDQDTGERKICEIGWADVTKRNTPIIKVMFSNGLYLECTPDHKIIMDALDEVEAKDLKAGDKIRCDGPTNIFVESVVDHGDIANTGCITVNTCDNNHNFLLGSGIFVRNSGGIGSKVEVLPGGCFAMDTKVSLLDGRELSISDIETEMASGKELWTYSCEPLTGKIVPGLISWAGVTHKSAKVMKFTLDNGSEFVCTPDHKFPTYEKEFKQAQEFEINDSFITLHRNTEHHSIELVLDNADCKWKFTDELVKTYIEEPRSRSFPSAGSVNNEPSIPIIVLVSNIEYLEDEIEVGTLTIDQDEKYHDYHTFALSCGIFTKNSNLGEMADLDFFNNKTLRGLRVPLSWMGAKGDKDGAIFNDGKIGAAYVEEQQFAKFIERLQFYIHNVIDAEFKKFLRASNINIDHTLFRVMLPEPSNYENYRQAELDNSLLSIISSAENIPWLSKRFVARRYLQLSEDEVLTNEQLVKEERGFEVNSDQSLKKIYGPAPEQGMGDMGMGMGGSMGGPTGFEQPMTDGSIPPDIAAPPGQPMTPSETPMV